MAADLPPTDATPAPSTPPPLAPVPATPRGSRRRGGVLTALVVMEGILLFLSTGAVFVGQRVYPPGVYPGGCQSHSTGRGWRSCSGWRRWCRSSCRW